VGSPDGIADGSHVGTAVGSLVGHVSYTLWMFLLYSATSNSESLTNQVIPRGSDMPGEDALRVSVETCNEDISIFRMFPLPVFVTYSMASSDVMAMPFGLLKDAATPTPLFVPTLPDPARVLTDCVDKTNLYIR
jgi:hypothetical protein